MNVTVFVPIQMTIKGEDKVAEVHAVLRHMDAEITSWGEDANPSINLDLVGDSEIVEDLED